MFNMPIKLEGVREYCEEMDVELIKNNDGRMIIKAWNEGGFNSTEVDLLDLLNWVNVNYPLWWLDIK